MARVSRARYAHIPATNCARPPKTAANGKRKSGVVGDPYQPAIHAATMNVAPAKANQPRTDGAAIGWRTMRVGKTCPFSPRCSSGTVCVSGCSRRLISSSFVSMLVDPFTVSFVLRDGRGDRPSDGSERHSWGRPTGPRRSGAGSSAR